MSSSVTPELFTLLVEDVEVESSAADEVELPPPELLDSPGMVGELGLLEFENPDVCAPPPPHASGAASRRRASREDTLRE